MKHETKRALARGAVGVSIWFFHRTQKRTGLEIALSDQEKLGRSPGAYVGDVTDAALGWETVRAFERAVGRSPLTTAAERAERRNNEMAGV